MLTIDKAKVHHFLDEAEQWDTYAEYRGNFHAENGSFDGCLTQEEWEGLKAADLKNIMVSQEMSENHPGGDDMVSLADDVIEAMESGYKVATWYGPSTEVLIVGYQEGELTLTDPPRVETDDDDEEDDEEDDEDDVVGYDQDGEPVTHHSTGHPACPAVHGGTCPIDGHNADDHDEPTGTLEDLAKGDE